MPAARRRPPPSRPPPSPPPPPPSAHEPRLTLTERTVTTYTQPGNRQESTVIVERFTIYDGATREQLEALGARLERITKDVRKGVKTRRK